MNNIFKFLSRDSAWIPPFHPKIHKNASKSSRAILSSIKPEKTFRKQKNNSKLVSKTSKAKPFRLKRNLNKVLRSWSMMPKKNCNKASKRSNKPSTSNQESFKVSQALSHRGGKKSNKFHKKFIKLPHKKFTKWQLQEQNRKSNKSSKTLSKEPKISSKMSRMLDVTLKRNTNKESVKLKKPQEWNLKKLPTKMSRKLLQKGGKVSNKLPKIYTPKQLTRLVK